MARIAPTAQIDAVIMAEQNSTVHNYAVTQKERKSTSPASLPIPPEIIRMIAGFLPENYAASLTLCSSSMKELLGDQCLKAMKNPPTQTFYFLPKVDYKFVALLARDLPQHFACFDCARINPIRRIKWPNNTKDHLGCVECVRRRGRAYSPKFLSSFEIYFPQVYLATKQHRSGIDIGFPLEAFRHVEIKYNRRTRRTTLISADARFAAKELLLRSQTWILLPRSQKDRIVEELARHQMLIKFCRHSESESLGVIVSELVRSKLSHTPTFQCSCCWTDFVVRLKHCGERGIAVIITRWIDLGAGLDPENSKWHYHIRRRKGQRHKYCPVDIQKAFEDQEGLSMDELTSGNQMKLFWETKNQMSIWGSDSLA
ncbi:hypothetical protein BOTCAL_0021g00200 [Botryotinia calthae]|uniref:F-box domain-containing protein n=1 Tax=Botryotinia calthae TaxID=38488 RepID=A0A4Y8DF10_9HELO|nr:hypothetical protein BOTCAL_0021g00200 [Botryotinia calthae]